MTSDKISDMQFINDQILFFRARIIRCFPNIRRFSRFKYGHNTRGSHRINRHIRIRNGWNKTVIIRVKHQCTEGVGDIQHAIHQILIRIYLTGRQATDREPPCFAIHTLFHQIFSINLIIIETANHINALF